jgi:hypothetical protein
MGKITRRVVFRIKWLVMSEKKRYAYLLARTEALFRMESLPIEPTSSHVNQSV